MDSNWKEINGTVVRGHHVASKASEHYPAGTIEMQMPFFLARGLDLRSYAPATINISIQPFQFRIVGEDCLFRNVEWTDRHPPEDFSFSRCRIKAEGAWHEGWIYYPHPETKARHHQDTSIIEVIAPYIARLEYGSNLVIQINEAHIQLIKNDQ